MCLTLRRAYRTPYNKSKIRYKVVRVSRFGPIWPPHQVYSNGPYSKRGWNTSSADKNLGAYDSPRGHAQEQGFHVFLNALDAEGYCEPNHRVYKVRVDGFLASGEWSCFKSETWHKMKFIKRIA